MSRLDGRALGGGASLAAALAVAVPVALPLALGGCRAPGEAAFDTDPVPGAPRVVSTEPADGATGVPVALRALTWTFSEALDVDSLAGGFALRSGGVSVPGELFVEDGGRRAGWLLAPGVRLGERLEYTLTLVDAESEAVVDLGGEPLEGPAAVRFETGVAAEGAP